MIDAEKKSRTLQLFLVGLCVVFVLVIVIEISQEYELSIDRASANQITEKNRVATIASEIAATKSLDDYEQIIARPLFMQDRRPYVAQEIVAAPQRSRKNNSARAAQNEYLLSAIIITDDKRIALLQSNRNKKLQKLNQGDEIDGWTLTYIQPAQVSLKRGSEIKLLELAVKSSPVQINAKQDKKIDTKERQSPLPDALEEDDESEPPPLDSDEEAKNEGD